MKPKKNPKKEVHQLVVGQQREKQKEQGFFDGRFVQRAGPSKKIYIRQRNKPRDEEWHKKLMKPVFISNKACFHDFITDC